MKLPYLAVAFESFDAIFVPLLVHSVTGSAPEKEIAKAIGTKVESATNLFLIIILLLYFFACIIL